MLTLEASNAGLAEWWIDGAFANHAEMHSHTSVWLPQNPCIKN